uniref:Uncharacterized protein n=1 Tax=Zonotrichia albicollis TaxID=44394 RepID=A0A8D2MVN8_ZONAL
IPLFLTNCFVLSVVCFLLSQYLVSAALESERNSDFSLHCCQVMSEKKIQQTFSSATCQPKRTLSAAFRPPPWPLRGKQ